MTIPKERHVLVVFPHPDDEAFGVSGTMSMHIEQGTPVTYACLTLGEMGRNLGNPPFATRESLPEIRRAELLASAEAIGVTDLRMMGLRDKTVEFEDDEKMTKMMEDLIAETNPSLVITFYPEYAVHPDHEATARAVVRAVGRMENRPKLHCVAFANNTLEMLGEPDIIHNIVTVRDKKIASMRAHISQTAWMLQEMEHKLEQGEPEAENWLTLERFYSYRWGNEFSS
ncbi:bacillithiol biosynthesis deacetylase BshB2 [Planomicrobium sp. YIM 101495]|uniref:bacillithiol biosynthesis deacetylase BshB2 n=1 Tax=Planomicrobium sp. YIM 101495 TaxID=2665160 RepID=UPI0012B7D82D|nr:bacillithiol biosynthesis deacetylase BshB2 [Planomicrobium sp. YIM 101495]MTD30900.1 bacillithiol biosynthesis deacetylase BshB2 [Planomicrobium sp. YIM 101495]